MLALFVEELREHLRAATGVSDGVPGTVTFLQHFGSTLNLHVHFHLLALDGVYQPEPLEFVQATVPTRERVEELLVRVARRVRALVGRTGPEPEEESPQVPLLKVFGAEPTEALPAELVASYDGFNLHAATAFEAHERLAVERPSSGSGCSSAATPSAGRWRRAA